MARGHVNWDITNLSGKNSDWVFRTFPLLQYGQIVLWWSLIWSSSSELRPLSTSESTISFAELIEYFGTALEAPFWCMKYKEFFGLDNWHNWFNNLRTLITLGLRSWSFSWNIRNQSSAVIDNKSLPDTGASEKVQSWIRNRIFRLKILIHFIWYSESWIYVPFLLW